MLTSEAHIQIPKNFLLPLPDTCQPSPTHHCSSSTSLPWLQCGFLGCWSDFKTHGLRCWEPDHSSRYKDPDSLFVSLSLSQNPNSVASAHFSLKQQLCAVWELRSSGVPGCLGFYGLTFSLCLGDYAAALVLRYSLRFAFFSSQTTYPTVHKQILYHLDVTQVDLHFPPVTFCSSVSKRLIRIGDLRETLLGCDFGHPVTQCSQQARKEREKEEEEKGDEERIEGRRGEIRVGEGKKGNKKMERKGMGRRGEEGKGVEKRRVGERRMRVELSMHWTRSEEKGA